MYAHASRWRTEARAAEGTRSPGRAPSLTKECACTYNILYTSLKRVRSVDPSCCGMRAYKLHDIVDNGCKTI